MRIIVMFDLPVTTSSGRSEYTKFRKVLIKAGFMMLQESIYCKLAQNTTAAESVVENIRRNKPSVGLIQILTITEKQFAKMEYISGQSNSNVLDTDERLTIL